MLKFNLENTYSTDIPIQPNASGIKDRKWRIVISWNSIKQKNDIAIFNRSRVHETCTGSKGSDVAVHDPDKTRASHCTICLAHNPEFHARSKHMDTPPKPFYKKFKTRQIYGS